MTDPMQPGMPPYKQPQRESTEARVQEKDEAVVRRRNAELDQELDDRIARENLGRGTEGDDAIHIEDPRSPELTLCDQRIADKLNVAPWDAPAPDGWGGCWTCLREARVLKGPLGRVREQEELISELRAMLEHAESQRDAARDQRDHLQRLFNRLEAAVTHHKAACERNDFPDTHDEALWAARDRVLRDGAKGA